ncbi:MAG: reverse transcriptase family protein [bacterium]|nr:reverse transcriptase family protein [bacterium]
MNLPQKIIDKINQLGETLEVKKIKVFPKIIETPKKRTLAIPNDYAKIRQKELHKLLLSIKIPRYVFSQKGFFFADKARFHLGDGYLINADLKDFYPSVHFKRIGEIFRGLRIRAEIVQKLTYLTTHQNYLPLGFITSPILSNIVLLKMDNDLYKYTKYRNIRYSRYVDDLTFSSNQKINDDFIKKARKIIKAYGFIINESKNQFYGPSDVKIVLGLKLEDTGINITGKYLEKVTDHLEVLKILIDNHLDYEELRVLARGELIFIKQIKKETFTNLSKKYSLILT